MSRWHDGPRQWNGVEALDSGHVPSLANLSVLGSELGCATKQVVKRVLFPGIDIHARARYQHLPRFFVVGDVNTLDAGCGNGMLSYAAWRRGNSVLGVTFDDNEVSRNRRYYASIGADDGRLRFQTMNLYDLERLGVGTFDQVICSETLEHIRDDAHVVEQFASLLRPRGVLHLCCPHAAHPAHALGRADEPEDGRHVRDGYTVSSYRSLLDRAGFCIDRVHGLGGPVIVPIDRAVRWARDRFGHAAGVPLFVATAPAMALDRLDPAVPFSLYVRALRRD